MCVGPLDIVSVFPSPCARLLRHLVVTNIKPHERLSAATRAGKAGIEMEGDI